MTWITIAKGNGIEPEIGGILPALSKMQNLLKESY